MDFGRKDLTIDNISIVKQITEKRREYNLESHMALIDYEKAFNRVNTDMLCKILEKRGYPLHLIKVINNLYDGTDIVICTDPPSDGY